MVRAGKFLLKRTRVGVFWELRGEAGIKKKLNAENNKTRKGEKKREK